MSKKFSASATDHAEWLADEWVDFLEEITERELDLMREVNTLRTYAYYASNAGEPWSDVSEQQKDVVKEMTKSQKWYVRKLAKWELRLAKADSRVIEGHESTRFLEETIARLRADLAQMPETLFSEGEIPDELARRRERKAQKSA